MYDYKRLILDYNIDELTDGAEYYLSEKNISIDERIDRYSKTQRSIFEIWARFNNDDQPENCRINIDYVNGQLISTYCSCNSFRKDYYSCKHITGALVGYLLKKNGKEFFSATELEHTLKEKTGVEEPFEKGALKGTDSKMAELLYKSTPYEKKSFENTVKTEKLKAEYHLETEAGVLSVGLKIGSKKMYVVKSMDNFSEAYNNNTEIVTGKDKVIAGRQAFGEKDREILDFLVEKVAEYNRITQPLRDRYYVSVKAGRDVKLEGSSADSFMEHIKEVPVFVNKRKMVYTQRNGALEINIKKLKYGAEISMKDISILGNGLCNIYAYDEDGIFSIPTEGNKRAFQLVKILKGNNVQFIGEKDLPSVCAELLPSLTPIASITTDKMELGQYMPEEPKLEMYLDYPQDDLISCKAYAVYSFGKYTLFSKVTEVVKRNLRKEQEAESALRPIFSAFEEESATLFLTCNEEKLFDFLAEKTNRLRAMGDVFVSDALNKIKARPITSMQVGISIESNLLDIKVNSDLFSMNELKEILSTYTGKKKYYRLKDGSFVSYNEEQAEVLKTVSEMYRNYAKKDDLDMKVPMFRAIYLNECLKDRDSVQFDKSRDFRRLVKNINTAQDGDYEAPVSLIKILRNYQREGFRWMKTLKSNNFGGILADDMGLGKTLQVLSFILSEKEEGKQGDELRTLIVTPASLVYNWQKEIEKFTPGLTSKVITGVASQRQNIIGGTENDADIWITSYDLLKRDIKEYEKIVFANQFIDEAQFIKNQTTQASKAVRLIKSSFRMALTGTPIENRLSELWSIFDYLMPGFLYTYSNFRSDYESAIVNGKDDDAMARLRKMVHPFILRRLKGDVLKELPEKLEETISVELVGEQKKLYNAYEQRLKMYLDNQSEEEFKNSKIEILSELTKLRRLCCSPELILEDYSGESAKLEACLELVSQAVEGGHKILIFSQYTSMLDIIGNALKDKEISYYRLDGSTSKENRMSYVDAFQTDDTPVFCISLKAGGTGLNLTAADIVIHYDPWWNLAAQNQATDRTHRIGQKKVVTVYQLIASGTIEDRIQKLQQSKYELAKEVLSGEGISSIVIDKNEIMNLLG